MTETPTPQSPTLGHTPVDRSARSERELQHNRDFLILALARCGSESQFRAFLQAELTDCERELASRPANPDPTP